MSTTTSAVTSSTTTSSTTSTSSSSYVSKDEFLKLLATELSNQDPLDPMDNKDTVAQLANFSALEQMQNLNTSFAALASNIDTLASDIETGMSALIAQNTLQQAAALIGKTVTYTTTDDNGNTATASGTVDSVKRNGSSVYLIVNGEQIYLSNVTDIKAS